jgi:DNA-directed RNA polymerase subunit L
MLVGLLTSKLNMLKLVVTNRDNTLMNAVAKVLPETQTIYFVIFILGRMSKLSASRIVESKRSLQMQKLLRKK